MKQIELLNTGLWTPQRTSLVTVHFISTSSGLMLQSISCEYCETTPCEIGNAKKKTGGTKLSKLAETSKNN